MKKSDAEAFDRRIRLKIIEAEAKDPASFLEILRRITDETRQEWVDLLNPSELENGRDRSVTIGMHET